MFAVVLNLPVGGDAIVAVRPGNPGILDEDAGTIDIGYPVAGATVGTNAALGDGYSE
ncbi:MAG: hypothetical protein IK119_01835 [Bacteroidales bacterium]|nr:hypothetical protein [Bacteroidales bacterium]